MEFGRNAFLFKKKECSTHLGDAQQPIGARTLTTHQLEVESEEIKESANYTGGRWGGQIEWAWLGSFNQDTGETISALGSFMTSVSQDLGFMSPPKDGFSLFGMEIMLIHI